MYKKVFKMLIISLMLSLLIPFTVFAATPIEKYVEPIPENAIIMTAQDAYDNGLMSSILDIVTHIWIETDPMISREYVSNLITKIDQDPNVPYSYYLPVYSSDEVKTMCRMTSSMYAAQRFSALNIKKNCERLRGIARDYYVKDAAGKDAAELFDSLFKTSPDYWTEKQKAEYEALSKCWKLAIEKDASINRELKDYSILSMICAQSMLVVIENSILLVPQGISMFADMVINPFTINPETVAALTVSNRNLREMQKVAPRLNKDLAVLTKINQDLFNIQNPK